MTDISSPFTRREFTARAGGAAVTAVCAPIVLAQDKSGAKPVVLGSGEHRYEAVHDWLKPPKKPILLWG